MKKWGSKKERSSFGRMAPELMDQRVLMSGGTMKKLIGVPPSSKKSK